MNNYPTGAAHDPEAPYNKEGRGYSCAARHAQHVCERRRLAGGGS